MARINLSTIQKITKEKTTVHAPVTTTYSVFDIDGERYVQLDTYGRSERVIPDKISQSIQLDRETAQFLVEMLVKEFDFHMR